jgi:hypothetical protein
VSVGPGTVRFVVRSTGTADASPWVASPAVTIPLMAGGPYSSPARSPHRSVVP